MSKISKDTPLAELTLRRYEKPKDIKGRELVRKLCLSIGILQPGDSRDIIVDILLTLLKSKKDLTAIEIEDLVKAQRKKINLPLIGIASSNIRRQLKRLKDIHMIENNANAYRITENASLTDIYNEKIKGFLLNSLTERTEEYFRKADEEF